MFYNCGSLTSIDLSSFYTNKVNNMVNMFYNCYILAYVDISSFKTNGYKVKLFNYLPHHLSMKKLSAIMKMKAYYFLVKMIYLV